MIGSVNGGSASATPKGTIITTAPSGSVVTLTKGSTVYTPSEVRRVNPKWRNLPSGYTQVDGTISSGNAYTLVPYKCKNGDKITVLFTPNDTQNYGTIFGVAESGTTNSGRFYLMRYYSGNRVDYIYNSAYLYNNTPLNNGTLYSITLESGKLTINGTESTFATTYSGNSQRNIALFGYNLAGSVGEFIAGTVHEFIISSENTEVVHLVPCKNSSNVAGFYDTVSNTFLGATSGTFTAGAEVSQYLDTSLYTKLVDYGTWTVQGTLSGKSASATVVVDATQEYEVELAYELYLYNAGDECTSITGGWDVSNSVVFQGWSSFSRTDATKGTDSINASLATNKTTSYGINNTVNVSAYSKIKFEINVSTYSSTTHMARLSLTSAKSFSATEEYAFVEYSGMNTGSYVWELDISDVANAGYVCISEFSITTQLSAVWLE